jgi:hypothetical protein
VSRYPRLGALAPLPLGVPVDAVVPADALVRAELLRLCAELLRLCAELLRLCAELLALDGRDSGELAGASGGG